VQILQFGIIVLHLNKSGNHIGKSNNTFYTVIAHFYISIYYNEIGIGVSFLSFENKPWCCGYA